MNKMNISERQVLHTNVNPFISMVLPKLSNNYDGLALSPPLNTLENF